MKIKEVNAQEYEIFASLEPNANIFQSNLYAEVLLKKGYEPLFIEYLNDNDIAQAFGAFYIKKDSFFSFKPSAYCFSGFLTNYYDHKLLKVFIVDLIEYFKTKNIKKLVIDPFVFLNEGKYSNQSITKVITENGFVKSDDKYFYVYNMNNNNKSLTMHNIFLKTIQLEKDYKQLHTLVNQESLDIYNSFKDKTILYAIELNVSKSITELNNELINANEFVAKNKDDIKLSQDVYDTLQRIKQINESLSYLDKFKQEKVITCVICIIKYSDKYYVLFLNDNNDSFLNYKELLLKDINKDAKKDDIKIIYSLNEMPNSDKQELIGEYTFNY